jgi:lipid II:glycine glycyltransferase (peptidoglycan interpeptide bridge formation enzyme)
LAVNIIDPTSDKRWDEFVAAQPNSAVFHTAAWARVIKETYGYSPRYYVVEGDNGSIRAALPLFRIKSVFTGNRLVSLPFSDFCSPLGGNEDVVSLLNCAKRELAERAGSYLEIRGWPEGTVPSQLGFHRRDYHLLYLLDLTPGTRSLMEQFHDNVRRGIHQAEKRGVTVRLTHNEADLELFYKLHLITRKKLGVLPQPHSFFKALYRNVIEQDLGFIGLGESEGKVIAGVIFLKHKDTVYYKFNASDEEYLQKRPNHLVTWEAIKLACAQNFKYFDFGRCSPEEEGLRTFKTRWAAKEITLPYYYYPKVRGISAASEKSFRYKVMRLFSRLAPLSMFESAGSFLYRHLG